MRSELLIVMDMKGGKMSSTRVLATYTILLLPSAAPPAPVHPEVGICMMGWLANLFINLIKEKYLQFTIVSSSPIAEITRLPMFSHESLTSPARPGPPNP